jgi:hypothetical protein
MPGSELAPAVNMVVSNSLWRNLFEQTQCCQRCDIRAPVTSRMVRATNSG